MSRLTKKDYKDWWHPAGTVINEQSSLYLNEVNHKLGKLEDLEDELGCPLEVVFKALKDEKIYIKHTIGFPSQVNKIKAHKISGLQFDGIHFVFWVYENPLCSEFKVELKDYKKTWCLKEDLSE